MNNRRSFLYNSFFSIIGLGILNNVKANSCLVGDKPVDKKIVEENSPTGKRIGYTHKIDESVKNNPAYKDGQLCLNCRFYNHNKEENGWSSCTMAANQYVSSCGWCKLYKLKV